MMRVAITGGSSMVRLGLLLIRLTLISTVTQLFGVQTTVLLAEIPSKISLRLMSIVLSKRHICYKS